MLVAISVIIPDRYIRRQERFRTEGTLELHESVLRVVRAMHLDMSEKKVQVLLCNMIRLVASPEWALVR